jgi:hypothetical protein
MLNQRFVKRTRKVHRCTSCGKDIPAGSSCVYFVWLVDGDFVAEYRHELYDCGIEEE